MAIFSHNVHEMADLIAAQMMHSSGEVLDREEIASQIRTVLYEYWEGKLALVWTKEDVREVGGSDLTDDHCEDILRTLLERHDATLGVNRDTIWYASIEYRKEKDLPPPPDGVDEYEEGDG